MHALPTQGAKQYCAVSTSNGLETVYDVEIAVALFVAAFFGVDDGP